MARLTIWLLGPPEIKLEGEPVTGLASNKVRALLFFLATEADRRRPETLAHRRESLAGLLWPDYPERSAHTNLSNALSHLRALLHDREAPSPNLTIDRETVQSDRSSDCWVDVAAFVDLASRSDPSALQDAVALHRGPFLEGFSLHDSPPFEQWALVTRERLQRQAMETLSRLAALQERQGEYERALAYARRQLEIEPWQEHAHQAVMRLLAQLGRRADALAQYEACCRVLKEELNVEPGPDTVHLYERIRGGYQTSDGEIGMPEPSRAQTEEPARTVAQRQHNLRAQSTPFVGRRHELAELIRLLADPQVRLVTVLGPGGSGKTRLALEAASRQVEHWQHGVWFASLAAIQSVEGIVRAVAQAMGFQFSPGSDTRQQLLDYLREKRMLLVLDNWEHLLEGVDLVADLLAVAPGVQPRYLTCPAEPTRRTGLPCVRHECSRDASYGCPGARRGAALLADCAAYSTRLASRG